VSNVKAMMITCRYIDTMAASSSSRDASHGGKSSGFSGGASLTHYAAAGHMRAAPPRSPTTVTDVAFERPAAFKGVYRPSDRTNPDIALHPIRHSKNLTSDLEWMYAHSKLDSDSHGVARIWAKLDPTASKGLTFEEWEHAIGQRNEHKVGKHVLRRLFEEMDVNHDGRVSMQELVDGKCFSMLDRLPHVDLACKEALKAALLHSMRPQGGHGKHARLGREAGRWMLSC